MKFIHQIIFFDIDKNNIKTYQKILQPISINFQFWNIDFVNLIDCTKIDIVISPSNSFLSMSGGIDKTYADLFPGIEEKLRNKLINKKYEKSQIKYKGTKYILPIVKILIAKTNNSRCQFIMSSPTMIMPRDISKTNNVYECMKAILKKLISIDVPIIIACPCLGTGIGNMNPEESARQIIWAFEGK